MIAATLVLTVMGFVLGGLLGLAARYLAVEESNPIVTEIEALLPNSQCGQCGFPGCTPAARAIAEGEADVTCCPPGGKALAEKLATILGIELKDVDLPSGPVLAHIEPSLCTGCTRCYKVCPTDAIIGATRQLHSVLGSACTGCRKCEEACPEDCISMQTEAPTLSTWHWPKPEAA